jgi:outer membrane scaffolding protein for murein synthesis (MipA/OmpV family)
MRRVLTIAAVAALVISSSASAQRGRANGSTSSGSSPIELGADASLSFGFGAATGNTNVTMFQVPIAQVRAGFFISPELSIEPSFGLQYASGGGVSGSHYNLGIGALYHFSAVRSASQVYVRPFLNFEGQSVNVSGTGGGNASETSIALGAGLGMKMPVTDRFSWRFEANLAHNNNTNFDESPNRIGLLAGFSYFTR